MDDTYPQTTYLMRPVRAVPQENEEKKIRIKTWMGAAMIIVALCIDCINALLNILIIGEIVSTLISIVATCLFTVWFWILGVTFIKNPKKLMAMGGQAVIGLIPIINTLPELTLGIAITIFLTWSEDGNGIIGKVAGKALNISKGKI